MSWVVTLIDGQVRVIGPDGGRSLCVCALNTKAMADFVAAVNDKVRRGSAIHAHLFSLTLHMLVTTMCAPIVTPFLCSFIHAHLFSLTLHVLVGHHRVFPLSSPLSCVPSFTRTSSP